MPFYVLYAMDKPDSLDRRLEHYAAHRTYIEANDTAEGVSVVMSGPLQTDDGTTMIGSLILIDAPSREAVEQFIAKDPFTSEGIWGKVRISRFHRRHMPAAPRAPREK